MLGRKIFAATLAFLMRAAPVLAQGTGQLLPGQGWANFGTARAPASPNFLRKPLTVATNIFVNAATISAACGPTGVLTCAGGNDATGNGTQAAPYQSANKALSVFFGTLDAAGQSVTILAAHNAGTTLYAMSCAFGAAMGTITIGYTGDLTSPQSVVLLSPNAGQGIFVKDGCSISLNGMQLQDQGTTAAGLVAANGGIPGGIDVRSTIFAGTWNVNSALVSSQGAGAIINMIGVAVGASITNTISSTTSIGYAFQVTGGGRISFANQSIAIPTGFIVTSPDAFFDAVAGFVDGLSASTFTGVGVASVTGNRCIVNMPVDFEATTPDPNSVFPGSVNCIPQNGVTVTWLPSLQGSSTAGSPTYASNCGTGAVVCRIGTVSVLGGVVRINFKISVSSLGTAAGNLQISNLPVNIGTTGSNSADDVSACSLGVVTGWTGAAGYTQIGAQARGTANFIDLVENGSGKTGQISAVSEWASTTVITGSCIYHS